MGLYTPMLLCTVGADIWLRLCLPYHMYWIDVARSTARSDRSRQS